MILYINSNVSNFSVSKYRSCADGYFYLFKNPLNKNRTPTTQRPINSTILILCKILRIVISSSTKSELGALFLNAQKSVHMRTTLQEVGYI